MGAARSCDINLKNNATFYTYPRVTQGKYVLDISTHCGSIPLQNVVRWDFSKAYDISTTNAHSSNIEIATSNPLNTEWTITYLSYQYLRDNPAK